MICNSDSDAVFAGISMSDDVQKELLSIIKRRMTPHPVKIRARKQTCVSETINAADSFFVCLIELDLRCTGIDGVNAIKAALKAGESVGSEEVPIKITYLAAPFYVVTVDSLDKKLGFDIIEKSIEAIKTELDKHAWTKFKVEKEAKLVSDSDDKDFAALLAQAEKENELVSGDEDEGDAVAASDDDM